MQLSKAYIKQSSKSQPNLRDICGLRKLFPTVALYFLTFVDGEKYARHIELRRSRRDIGPRTLAHATTSTCKSASGHGHAEPGMVLLSSGRVHPVGGLVPGFLYRRRRGPARLPPSGKPPAGAGVHERARRLGWAVWSWFSRISAHDLMTFV